MTVGLLTFVVAILFFGICYLHFKINAQDKMIKSLSYGLMMNMILYNALTQTLKEKKVLTDDDISHAISSVDVTIIPDAK